MDRILAVVFGMASFASLGFAVWQHHKTRINQLTEQNRVAMSLQRIKQAYNMLHAVTYTADQIVQRSKKQQSNASELCELARAIRAQTFVLMAELKTEHSRMKSWRYGVMIPSEDLQQSDDELEGGQQSPP